ncbi:hypothetical protein Nepgr_032773 [Nepenthes gracilis]|uniref:3-ketoacyl-CoA synthase n=1 Tax=Nepenthes gracilis TaxID=150966 RepID=A0AAD3Y7X6_NEPGR|nr:hypothetical protein Nepgr_032773 [Nepenthes gracilis]
MLPFRSSFTTLKDYLLSSVDNHSKFTSVSLLLIIITFLTNFLITLKKPSHKIYLVDFACYKAKCLQKVPNELVLERMKLYGNFTEEAMNFFKKTLERSGLGPATYLPEGLLMEPPNTSRAEARREGEAVMFGVVDELLQKTGVRAAEIGIVVVNCSAFIPVPSLSAMIVNKYKLREDIMSYNLSGMGCSAGLAAIGLAKQLLQVHKDSYALIASIENTTENVYRGNHRPMLVINCVFRVGGAAILLSGRTSDRRSSKYELIHTVHTNTASSDRSYSCIFQGEDSEGLKGITVTKDLLTAASKTIEANLAILAPRILPTFDLLRFATNYAIRKLQMKKIKPYIPNFRGAVDHFYSHVGGKPVLDELQRNLSLSEIDMEPSRMTLYRFGNTSSSSIWYELAYGEAKGRIKAGDRLWQIAFGSGFKCSSAIWRAIRAIDREDQNPWSDEIDDFPVHLNNLGPFPNFFEPSN